MHLPEFVDAMCNTADGVYVVNADQRIIRWNKGAEKILNCPESEVLDHECFRVIAGRTESDKPWCRANCKVRACIQNNIPVENFEVMRRNDNGETKWFNISIVSSRNGAGPLTVHILRDISREKHIRQAIDEFLLSIGARTLGKTKVRMEKLARQQVKGKVPSLDGLSMLSKREIQVLTLLAEGLSTKALAERLQISHFTARNHIQNILVKLNLHNKSQAVSYAFKKGLL